VTSKTVVVKYVKSCIGYPQRQKRTLRALGLKFLGDEVIVQVSPATQGMLDKIDHLVQVEPAQEEE
jgi:large subunit ribosomal protein L30